MTTVPSSGLFPADLHSGAPRCRRRWAIAVALYGLIELYQGVYVLNSGVAHFAHLGGMLGGLLTLRYWRGQAPFGRR